MVPIASPVGLHRVVAPDGVLPQAAETVNSEGEIYDNEARIRVEKLNLDAASYRQLHSEHNGDSEAIRANVLEIIQKRGKMHNPVTGSGGMLIGTVEEVGPDWSLDLSVGQKIATLVSLSLTPLEIYDGLEQWDGLSEQIPTDGHAVLFERTIAAALPDDFPENVALSAFDVCGAPALTRDIVTRFRDEKERPPTVAVIGGAGKSGSLALAAARKAGSSQTLAVVYDHKERKAAESATLADHVIVADATDPIAVSQAVAEHGGADITVVCVDVPGSEHGAILSTNAGGTIIFFSMATSFSGAALGAEGLAADVEMIIGNGYRPGHADYTLSLLRDDTSLRRYFFQLAQGEQS